MTIYTIVNTLSGGTSECRQAAWTIISPAGILQGGNPYFVPDFALRFEARCAIALRIGRLGKGIASRFAHRYVAGVAPCVLFIAPELLASLRADGMPWTRAVSYDRCLALGRFTATDFGEIPRCRTSLELRDREGNRTTDVAATFMYIDAGAIIECLSRDNTLKTGDIIICGLQSSGPEVSPGLSARLSLGDEECLRFNIR